MSVQVMKSEEARINWRDVLDLTSAGNTDVVIERYGKPTSAVISYAHYQVIQSLLDEIRALNLADEAFQLWKENPARARPYADFRQELIDEDLMDGDA
jgi:PHD/YefM family antitoxin component YafN of YafNO toxin-antitoxin module